MLFPSAVACTPPADSLPWEDYALQPEISISDSRGFSSVALQGTVNCRSYFRECWSLYRSSTLKVCFASSILFKHFVPPPPYPPLRRLQSSNSQHQRGFCIAASVLLSLAIEGFSLPAFCSCFGGILISELPANISGGWIAFSPPLFLSKGKKNAIKFCHEQL